MDSYIPKEKLTAYQRWELAAFDEEERARRQDSQEAPPVQESTVPMPALPTAEEIERIHTEAQESGFQAGFQAGEAAGRAEGLAAGKAEGLEAAKAAAAQLQTVVESFTLALGEMEQSVADQLLSMGLEIARQMTRASLKAHPEQLLPIIREALAALPVSHAHPVLHLHPEDSQLLQEQLGDQIAHGGWRLLADSEVERGGCRIEAGSSEVDATLPQRWKKILEAIGVQQDWLAP